MLVTLHDHLNPSQEVLIETTVISSVVPMGSGSAVKCGTDVIGVQESVAQIANLIFGANNAR
jgi:hypothetical protein